MIVDDDEVTLTFCQRVLQDYETFVFKDPKKALQYCEKYPFDLLLADRLSPVADLVAHGRTATVHETDALVDVVEIFIDSRGTSVVVIDGSARPVGRILADDVIDALLEDRRLARRAS